MSDAMRFFDKRSIKNGTSPSLEKISILPGRTIGFQKKARLAHNGTRIRSQNSKHRLLPRKRLCVRTGGRKRNRTHEGVRLGYCIEYKIPCQRSSLFQNDDSLASPSTATNSYPRYDLRSSSLLRNSPIFPKMPQWLKSQFPFKHLRTNHFPDQAP